ncbi:hypothetical protein M23134_07145 [Microscilla marina ATCC 23134]|uniref:Uncharacterized protein n=1 Tax=Microscilla marina ATCC 23134 TaxID=313606 RepID=A1ZUH7_MICM2|nr:hypothetical protein M23134_07145 [Microscilla marina ATCC 23134]
MIYRIIFIKCGVEKALITAQQMFFDKAKIRHLYRRNGEM